MSSRKRHPGCWAMVAGCVLLLFGSMVWAGGLDGRLDQHLSRRLNQGMRIPEPGNPAQLLQLMRDNAVAEQGNRFGANGGKQAAVAGAANAAAANALAAAGGGGPAAGGGSGAPALPGSPSAGGFGDLPGGVRIQAASFAAEAALAASAAPAPAPAPQPVAPTPAPAPTPVIAAAPAPATPTPPAPQPPAPPVVPPVVDPNCPTDEPCDGLVLLPSGKRVLTTTLPIFPRQDPRLERLCLSNPLHPDCRAPVRTVR